MRDARASYTTCASTPTSRRADLSAPGPCAALHHPARGPAATTRANNPVRAQPAPVAAPRGPAFRYRAVDRSPPAASVRPSPARGRRHLTAMAPSPGPTKRHAPEWLNVGADCANLARTSCPRRRRRAVGTTLFVHWSGAADGRCAVAARRQILIFPATASPRGNDLTNVHMPREPADDGSHSTEHSA